MTTATERTRSREVASRLAVLVLAGLAVGGIGLRWFLTPRTTPAERGAQLARDLGCTGCHGPGGTGGVPNPGSREREIPGFTGGTAMMYVESTGEIAEWILDGRPARLTEGPAGPDALVAMPAYRGRIDEGELADLVAWYRAVARYDTDMPDAARKGQRVAARAGCFGCHGAGGRIGAGNPGSLKSYIPGWGSDDFYELTRDEGELREWIRDGAPRRLREHPVASALFERQAVVMPAYGDVLTGEEIDAVVAYVRWLAPGLPPATGTTPGSGGP